MATTLSLPIDTASLTAELAAGSELLSASQPKFPHTRAQLSSIARQYKPLDSTFDVDVDGDYFARAPSSLVTRVASMLDEEREDDLKVFLKSTYGMEDNAIDQAVLDLMHKYRDDLAGVPFLFLTPTRRPISRPSSRASTNSTRLYPARPETPQSAPGSPLAHIFRRPHTPLASPLATNAQPSSYMTAKSDYSVSPSGSPILTHAITITTNAQYTASLPASPLSSPRLLNARASEFKPIQRPLSAASSNPGPRTETPSPDLWAHGPARASSNLAIAAPLLPEQSLSRSLTPSSGLRSSMRLDEDDEDDEGVSFDPYAPQNMPVYGPFLPEFNEPHWSNPSSDMDGNLMDGGLMYPFQMPYPTLDSPPQEEALQGGNEELNEEEANAQLTDGMTPFDVLTSVFGSSLAPSELEEALAANGYDFDRAMAWLIDRALPAPPQASQVRVQNIGGKVTLVSGAPPGRGGFVNNRGTANTRFVNGRPVPNGNRVCRYFMAGECLRADCRFSHDLERALCRFWLRGACAKQENCEFLHRLPENVDMASLTNAMARANVAPGIGPLGNLTQNMAQSDEFPVLGHENGNANGKRAYGPYNSDPSRTRFAAAVKKPAVPPLPPNDPTMVARREIMGAAAESLHHRSAIIAPRPSPRLKLRPPALLPTLPTGEAVSNLYMSYRKRALQLGAARNACLSRAADAWRRGDGQAAKRFSREGHELNGKMAKEMASAAAKLVRERAKMVEQAVRAREANWSDDAGDRTTRGRPCGASLGVCLGIADRNTGDGKLTAEERTECVLDLHGLHANEANEVLEEFLLALEQEHFYGLAYIIVGEEKHTGTQDVARGASRARLATGVREWIHRWGYPWSERDGIICVDPLTHAAD